MSVFLELATTMIDNKAPYISFDEAPSDFIENYEYYKEVIRSRKWCIIEEKVMEGGYWIIPVGLEKYAHGLIVASVNGHLPVETVNRILSDMYRGTRRGEAVIVAEFIEDFNVPREEKEIYATREYIGLYEIVLPTGRKIYKRVYYCNDIYDEWGNEIMHGVFKCAEYMFTMPKSPQQ